MARVRCRTRGSSKPTNPFSARGLEKLSQLTSELTATREQIASRIGASLADVRLTTAASSNNLVAIFPSSVVHKHVAAQSSPPSLLVPLDSSTPLDHSQQNSKSQELPSSADPLPKVRTIPKFLTLFFVFVSYIKGWLKKLIGGKQESVHRHVESLAFDPDLASNHSLSLFPSERDRLSLHEEDILHSVASSMLPGRHSNSRGTRSICKNMGNQQTQIVNFHNTAALTGSSMKFSVPILTPLRRILVSLPQESKSANSNLILSSLKALEAIGHGTVEKKTKSFSMAANPKGSLTISGREHPKPMIGMRARSSTFSRQARFHARQDRSYGVMVMLVIILGGLIFGVVPGILITTIAWFILPILRGIVRNRDLGITGAVATKRKQSSTSSKVRNMNQVVGVQKKRCMLKSIE
ncbi:hypothetical protein O6H91_12G070200 [Diphasiastrum complanatum]|uniref:Uncharacterized protein n=2 Tax=Diphasiastrum complanatum TaxID=34168 RepID=A0ACC2C341_DIPCM|nr:hypothetical protein O6H91_12G069500 [Diphasiastrum complanatum]KAJ7536455.1 hypothetical protein O6H91_12G070200 [Diphasiastrum complanatum]